MSFTFLSSIYNILLEKLLTPSIYPSTHEQELLLKFFNNTKNGKYIDIGGNHPDSAVSKIFWEIEWEGFVVEPLTNYADKFRKLNIDTEECALTSPEKATSGQLSFTVANRQSTLDAQQIMDRRVITGTINVPVTTLGNLLDKRGWTRIDFLSIDTEGTEVDVLRGINFEKTIFKLILIEDWGRDFSIHIYLTEKKYKRVLRTGFNSWYIPQSTPWVISLYGRLQFLRKFVLSMPFKKLRKWRHKNMKKTY